jgi:phospholipase C
MRVFDCDAKTMLTSSFAVAAFCAGSTLAGSLTDIKHVVLFMQENRAFDHVRL